jgi:hypothetical protein
MCCSPGIWCLDRDLNPGHTEKDGEVLVKGRRRWWLYLETSSVSISV